MDKLKASTIKAGADEQPRCGRPLGEVRAAMRVAAQGLHAAGQSFTWRELASAAQVGLRVARCTTKEMVRFGDLRTVGTRKVAGCRRPLNLYVPAGDAASGNAIAALQGAIEGWFTRS